MDDLKEESTKARRLADILSDHTHSQMQVLKRIKLANYAVGAAGIIFGFISYTPQVRPVIGETVPIVMAALGAAFFLLEASSHHFLDDPNPARFGDYEYFIRKCARDLTKLSDDTELPALEWNAAADVLLDLARANFDDVQLKFKHLIRRLEVAALPDMGVRSTPPG